MKASLCMLLAAIAICVSPAAARPQYPGEPYLWQGPRRSPEQNLGPNSPFDPRSPFGLRNPYDPQQRINALNLHGQPNPFGSDGPPNPFGPPSSAGPHGVLPPEPRVNGVINQGKSAAANPATIAPIPELPQPLNPAPAIDPRPPLAPPPVVAEPPVAPPGQGWEWVAVGVGALCLLALLLGATARKPRPVPPEGAPGDRP